MAEMIEHMGVDSIDQRESLLSSWLEQAREQNIELVSPGGLLGELTKRVLEPALDAEMSEHLGYDKHDPAGRGSGRAVTGHAPRRCSRRSDWSRSRSRGTLVDVRAADRLQAPATTHRRR
jgi:hypothetical protein